MKILLKDKLATKEILRTLQANRYTYNNLNKTQITNFKKNYNNLKNRINSIEILPHQTQEIIKNLNSVRNNKNMNYLIKLDIINYLLNFN